MKKTLPASTRLSLTKACAPPDWPMPETAVCTGVLDWSRRLGSPVTRAPIGCVLVRLLLGLLRPFVWGWQTPFAWKTRSRRCCSATSHAFRKHRASRAAPARTWMSVQHSESAGIYQIVPKVIAETHKEWRERCPKAPTTIHRAPHLRLEVRVSLAPLLQASRQSLEVGHHPPRLRSARHSVLRPFSEVGTHRLEMCLTTRIPVRRTCLVFPHGLAPACRLRSSEGSMAPE